MTFMQTYAIGIAPQNDRANTLAALIGTAVSVALVLFVLASALLTGVRTSAETHTIASIGGP
jgi:hypothetical protein